MKFIVLAFLVASTTHLTCAQVDIQGQERQTPDFSIRETPLKRKNAFFHAVKVPTVLIGMGVYSCLTNDVRYHIREERNEHLPSFRTTVDNYLMHAPVALVYGLNMVGVKGKHDFKNRTLLLVKSEAIMYALTFSLKAASNVQRP